MSDEAAHDAPELPAGDQASAPASRSGGGDSSQPPSTSRGIRVQRGARRYLPEAATEPGDTRDTRDSRDSESAPISARWDASRLPLVDPGNYARTEEAGQGGIGMVWKVQDVRLGRTVALKELRESGRGARERFLREALVTARLQHPSIVPVYEAGRWPTGEPFYAMKHVSGESLDHVIEKSKTMAQRLALLPHVLAVAEAVAYAHSEKILHRDLKPSNVLLGSFGETMVIDWGLAKDLNEAEMKRADHMASEASETKPSGLTLAGSVMGTPAYMPPEQALGLPVDERADVYALGAILYHVLSGRPPYSGANSKEILKHVLEGPPPPLPQANVPPDLAALVNAAMARDPSKRYASAKEFADDLRRYQTGQIVGAHTYSWRERLVRLVKRHRTAVIIAGISLLLLAAVSGLSLLELVEARMRAERERDRASEKQLEAERSQRAALLHADELSLARADELSQSNPNEALQLLSTLSPWFSNWSAARAIASNARSWGISRQFNHGVSVNSVEFLPNANAILTGADDRLIRRIDLATGEMRVYRGHTDEVYWLSISPDGKQFISWGKDKRALLWNMDTGEHRELCNDIDRVTTSKDFLYYGCVRAGVVKVVERASGKIVIRETHEKSRGALAFSADGRRVAQAFYNALWVWDLPSGKPHRREVFKGKAGEDTDTVIGAEPPPATLRTGAVLSPDGLWAAAARADGQILLWNTIENKINLFSGHTDDVNMLLFSPDGRTLVSTSRDETVRFWDVASGKSTVLAGHKGRVYMLVFSPDGAWVASAGTDKNIRIFSADGREGWVLRGASEAVHWCAFSPDGQRFAAASADSMTRLWDLDSIGSRILAAEEHPIEYAQHSEDRRSLVYAASDRHVHVIDVEAARSAPLRAAPPHEDAVQIPSDWINGRSALSADGRVLVVKLVSGSLFVADVRERKTKELYTNPDEFSHFVLDRDGRTLLGLSSENRAERLDLASGKREEAAHFAKKMVRVAMSPDGSRVAFGGADGTILWLALGSPGAHLTELTGHTGEITALDFSGDARKLLSGSRDHTVRLWDLERGTSKQVYLALPAAGFYFLNRDEDFLARSPSSSIKMYTHTEEGFRERVLPLHTANISAAALSDDGLRFSTAGDDHIGKLLDMASFRERPLIGHTKKVLDVFFTRDGAGIVTVGADGTVRYWKDDLPFESGALRAWIEKARAESINVQVPAKQP